MGLFDRGMVDSANDVFSVRVRRRYVERFKETLPALVGVVEGEADLLSHLPEQFVVLGHTNTTILLVELHIKRGTVFLHFHDDWDDTILKMLHLHQLLFL